MTSLNDDDINVHSKKSTWALVWSTNLKHVGIKWVNHDYVHYIIHSCLLYMIPNKFRWMKSIHVSPMRMTSFKSTSLLWSAIAHAPCPGCRKNFRCSFESFHAGSRPLPEATWPPPPTHGIHYTYNPSETSILTVSNSYISAWMCLVKYGEW